MYEAIQQDIQQDFYQQKFQNDGQRFIAWYLKNVYGLDNNEAYDCITDGSDDKQIDAVYVDDSKQTVFVIQGKFYQGETVNAEPLRETLSSWEQLKNPKELQNSSNEKLKRKLVDIGKAFDDDYDVCFELLTTSCLTDAASDDFKSFQRSFAEDDDFSARLVLVDDEELASRYEVSLGRDNPSISHDFVLEDGKYFAFDVDGTNVVLAAVSLKDSLKIPGIKDQTLFKKNVRNSLGSSNKVNKAMRATISNDPEDFFFCHNGITAICTEMELHDSVLSLHGLNVVNGCQSLNTIYSSSEIVKELNNAYVMFRFYEIPERDRADMISISTNSQSAVKARDLRSNDKRILRLKKAFEQRYPNGYFITKRGEEAPAEKSDEYIVDMATLGKVLMAWHSQRPNISYSETKVFDKYFDNIFKKDYSPERVQALNELWREVQKRWEKNAGNPLGLNESLLAMRAYAPYHHLYTISVFANALSKMPVENVPDPAIVYGHLKASNTLDMVVDFAGTCLNNALETAANEPLPNNRVFSPQNWIKTKGCLASIRTTVNSYISMLSVMPNGGADIKKQLEDALHLSPDDFSERYTAD